MLIILRSHAVSEYKVIYFVVLGSWKHETKIKVLFYVYERLWLHCDTLPTCKLNLDVLSLWITTVGANRISVNLLQ